MGNMVVGYPPYTWEAWAVIRIIDEPVFELTMAEHQRLRWEYARVETGDLTFEEWLLGRGTPHTVQGRIKP